MKYFIYPIENNCRSSFNKTKCVFMASWPTTWLWDKSHGKEWGFSWRSLRLASALTLSFSLVHMTFNKFCW